MSVQYSVTTGLTAITTSVKTMIELNTTSSTPGELIALDVSSSYLTTSTPISLLVELGTASASGTGTGATIRRMGAASGTAQTTSKINDTVEGTSPTVYYGWEIVLPSGPWCYQWPLGREYFLAVSTFNIIRVTASAACSIVVNATFEE